MRIIILVMSFLICTQAYSYTTPCSREDVRECLFINQIICAVSRYHESSTLVWGVDRAAKCPKRLKKMNRGGGPTWCVCPGEPSFKKWKKYEGKIKYGS